MHPDAVALVPPDAWGGARLIPCPWYAWLDLQYPVDTYYQGFRDGLTPCAPEPTATTTVVLRDGLAIRRINVSPRLRGLLRRLLGSETLGAAMGELAADVDGDDVQASFQTWIASGLFSGICARAARPSGGPCHQKIDVADGLDGSPFRSHL